MKKTLLLFLTLLIFVFAVPVGAAEIQTGAQSAVLIDAKNGEILYGKNENARRGMASTTKIMTAIVVLERIPTDTVVRVAPQACGIEGSSVYLTAGESITIETLLYALMLQSANDAAAALAYAVSGSMESFVELMNEKAEELGLRNTHFDNPHGLDGDTHYTTAYELALISAYALKNDRFREIVSTVKRTVPLHDGTATRLLVNHNRLLRDYDDIIGVKTGYTRACGRTLVSAAERDGIRLICVTLNDGNDWADHRALLDHGFSAYETRMLADVGEFSCSVAVCGGERDAVTVANAEALSLPLPVSCEDVLCVTELPRFLYGGVRAGQTVGHVRFFRNGEEIGSVALVCEQSVPVRREKRNIFRIWIERFFSA